jgi:hypothetical protein
LFSEKLQFGKTGESEIAQWLRGRGLNVLPVYEVAQGQYKGPAIYTADGGDVIATDMLVFKGAKAFWIEAKHKSAFTWHRKTQRWVTGIDKRHYEEYLRIGELSDWPVWLLFLHKDGCAKDTPSGMISPTGLFGGELNYLRENINHTHDNWGNSGMVYWAHDKLKCLWETI